MGAKNSKRTSIDEDIRTTRVAPQRRNSTRCLQFSCCIPCCKRKNLSINNESSSHARLVITPTPITNLTSVQVEKLGGLELETKGEYKPQKFRIMANSSKNIRVKSHSFYVSCFLLINNGWKLLWENRVFSSTEDIAILPRHIEEAKLDFTNQVAEDQEERVCNRTVTIRSTIL